MLLLLLLVTLVRTRLDCRNALITTRNCHNHKLQTNPWYGHLEEAKKINASRYKEDNNNKATNSFFLSEMIANLERTQNTVKQNIPNASPTPTHTKKSQ